MKKIRMNYSKISKFFSKFKRKNKLEYEVTSTEDISKIIKAYRENKNITQTELAKRSGMEVSFYNDKENSKRNMTFETFLKIVKKFKIVIYE